MLNLRRFQVVIVILVSAPILTHAFDGAGAPQNSELGKSTVQPPQTLLESIAIAIKYNDKSKARDLDVQSLHELTLAAQTAVYPSGYFSCSTSQVYDRSHVSGTTTNSKSFGPSCSLVGSVTLYDGGALRNSYLSAQAREEALQQTYNENTSYVKNTKGNLAQAVISSYLTLASYKEAILFSQKAMNYLVQLQSIARSQVDQQTISNSIQSLQGQIESSKGKLAVAARQFKYVVTVNPSENIDTLADTLKNLTLPQDADTAFAIAKDNNSEILATAATLKARKYAVAAAQAGLGPQVNATVVASSSSTDFHDGQRIYSRDSSASIGITASIPLSISARHSVRSQEISLQAAQFDNNAALQDTYESIVANYENIAIYKSAIAVAELGLNNEEATIQSSIAFLKENPPNLSVNFASTGNEISRWAEKFSNLLESEGGLLGTELGILSSTGSLVKSATLMGSRNLNTSN